MGTGVKLGRKGHPVAKAVLKQRFWSRHCVFVNSSGLFAHRSSGFPSPAAPYGPVFRRALPLSL